MWNNPMMNNYPYSYNQPTQTIGQLGQQVQKQAACYFVKDPSELASLNVMPGVFYLGINRENKEIYVRRMNNDGNIELEQYTLSVGKKEKTDIQEVLERLNVIEKKLEAKDESVAVNANQ